MCILTSSPNSKFLKDCIINDIPVKSFVDLGSEVTLLTQSLAATLNLKYNSPPLPLRGFGNDIVHSSGGVDVELSVDGVRGRVRCQVVDDSFLDLPLLIGQSFTEQPHVIVYKNALELKFLNDNYEFEFPRLDFDDNKPVTIIVPFDVDIFGPALVKAHVDTVTNGDILPVIDVSSTKNKRKTTVAADRMLPWVHVAALDVNKDSDNDDASSFDDEEIDE
ncbi:hypothetical protein SFRURICE_002877 [Spodoptera frugiperda]|nr:hypothetical protein SFRURICE_002877 [Spodoptera frugiperda]